MLGETDAGDLGRREHGRRDERVLDHARLAAELGVGEGVPLANGDRRQRRAVRYVADGEDAVDRRLRVLVDDDVAVPAELDTDFVEAEAERVRRAADSEHDLLGGQRRAVRQMPDEPGAGLLEVREDVPGDDADALLDVGLGETVAQILVEAAQDLVAAIDDRRLDAEVRENAGELHGDVAATGDDDPLRQARQIERLVGGDDVLEPGSGLGEPRRAACRDEDLAGGDRAAGFRELHRVGADDRRALLDQLDAHFAERRQVRGLEARNLLVLSCDQRRPIEGWLSDRPAEAAGVLEVVGEAAGIDEQLLGHAAADDAGAADAIFLGDGDLGAVAGRDATRAYAARAGTDHEQIVVEFSHTCVAASERHTPSPSSAPSRVMPPPPAMTARSAMPMNKPFSTTPGMSFRASSSSSGSSMRPKWQSRMRLPPSVRNGLPPGQRAHADIALAADVGGKRGDHVAGRREAEGHDLERQREGAQGLDLLGGVGDDDHAAGRGGNDLLAQQGAAAAFDQAQLAVDLVGTVDGQIEKRQIVQRRHADAESLGLRLRRRGGGDTNDLETAGNLLAEQVDELRGRRAGAEAEPHSAFDILECALRGCDLQGVIAHGFPRRLHPMPLPYA